MDKMEQAKWKIKKENRRKIKGLPLFTLLFFLFFPYGASLWKEGEVQTFTMEEKPGIIWVEKRKPWGKTRVEMEEYLIGMVAGSIPYNYEEETLKAQAIILRSHCLSMVEKEGGRKIVREENIEEYYMSYEQCEKLWKEEAKKRWEKIEKAVRETRGKIILYREEIIAPPFFLSGNGNTRDIKDYPKEQKNFAYLKTVSCKMDMEAEDYISYLEIEEKEFLKKIKKYLQNEEISRGKITIYRDSTGYVKVVEMGKKQINGEDFRQLFSLNSSCFFLEKINEKIQFKTQGKGHGFGFSQFQANEMAKEGRGAEEILAYFFQEIQIKKM